GIVAAAPYAARMRRYAACSSAASRLQEDDMAERTRPHERDAPDRRPDELPNYPQGYDETVRHGPPIDTSVARGDYHAGRDNLASAGVRGYGEPGAYQQWGERDYDERGTGEAFGEGPARLGSEGDYAPASDLPPGF